LAGYGASPPIRLLLPPSATWIEAWSSYHPWSPIPKHVSRTRESPTRNLSRNRTRKLPARLSGAGKDAERTFKDAIQSAYGVESRFVEAVPVSDTFQDKVVWSKIVHIFDLIDHPEATRAYVWSDLEDEVSGRQRITVILHAGPVQSPLDAVRAGIVREHKDPEGA
jgi:hypothetical protein